MGRIAQKIRKIITGEPELPKNYVTDYDEGKNKYFWYYLGRKEGKKDYSNKKYFDKHIDAIKGAVAHHKSKKK